MKYFLDSAKLDEIDYAFKNWGIDGVTTNPRHIEASGLPFREAIAKIAAWVKEQKVEGWKKFPVSVEIDPYIENAGEMVKQARELAALSPNFVIKVPCTEQGIVASRRLEAEGIRTNVTLVFSPSQAIAAARNKALFVSPFVGWKESSGEDTGEYIAKICDIFYVQNYETEVLVAALRSGRQIADAAALGADIVTCGFQVYKDSFYHAFTDYGLNVFRNSWDKIKK
jgi:transaldolase